MYVIQDPFMQLFFSPNCLRPSCGGNCKYRGQNKRPGDITIADFKGLTKVFPQLKGVKKNYSTIVINTTKAQGLVQHLYRSMDMRTASINDVIEYNPLIDHQTWVLEVREAFFHDFVDDPRKAIECWTTPFILYRLSFKKKLFNMLPTWITRIVITVLNIFK